ncbi:uncharacterized protein FMAN_07338 [Fusarium mangiferae]|uniref:C2H2-type domain-containing protein n=1 Tax=Fusarium mangiferae TaxID=192010 RepID=A0A1L7T6U5_FUSMA|nr:uncharacterized protein FMAN_07338 [Fusarium mangiferae]CVK92442.1 uncharacterized protein FMAN_07338 [Fusarium mangiferae]
MSVKEERHLLPSLYQITQVISRAFPRVASRSVLPALKLSTKFAMLVCTLPSAPSSLQRTIIDGQGNDDVRFYPDNSNAYCFIPPAFGLQHRRFKFQSPAEIEGDDLKKKLDSGYHLCSPPCARPGSNPTQRTSLSHKHEPTGCQKGNKSKAPGFLCKCCPKRRKRFSTLEELINHENDTQHECSFCGSRFKNKNEAKRHENSLHIRRSSWSCPAISEYHQAFYISLYRPEDTDICGFCGDEFIRAGPSLSDIEIEHLQRVHKIGECNSSKRFYRIDHFQQHLNHFHTGRIGEWTTMLENTCMRMA